MSDPSIPSRPVAPGLVGTPSGVAPGAPRSDYSRTTVNVESPVSRPVKSGNGFSTGLMVALAFVVVAILAYSVLGNRDSAVTTPDTVPAVSIENNAAPAPAPDAVAPDAVVPDAATPDAPAADPAAPAPDAAPAAPANP